MSKKKHNVNYIKQEDPKFLKLMKQEIGYKEGPTVETKVNIYVIQILTKKRRFYSKI